MYTETDKAIDDALLAERFKLIVRILPVLYATIFLLVCILSYQMNSFVPGMFLLIWTTLLLSVSAVRGAHWVMLRIFGYTFSPDELRRKLNRANYIGTFACLVFIGIAYAVISIDDLFTQSVIMMIVWGAAIGTAFYLFVLPVASNAILIIATAVVSFVFMRSGNELLMMSVVILGTMSAAFMHLLHAAYNNFIDVVTSKVVIESMRQDATDMAFTDSLTGLPNRRLFEQALEGRGRDGRRFAVAILDLDGFKSINDIHGHAVGDTFLAEASRRFKENFQPDGVLARLGGDEFALLIDAFKSADEVINIIQRLIDTLSRPFVAGDIVANLSASCGVALSCADDEADRLLGRADLALYEAKSKARGRVVVFSDSLEREAQNRAVIEQALRAAIAKDELTLNYQPIVDLATGRICGFEALARWRHPELGPISPARFIPIAEQAGLIDRLTDHLLRKAARAANHWPDEITLSFNLSAMQLERPSGGLSLLSILNECGFSPSRLEIEVTETTFMADMTTTTKVVENLKQAGVRIALDDFGTGYSSFSQLCSLPLDKLKIDKSFIENMGTDDRALNVVRTIIRLCSTLGLDCVAEGIETIDQLNLLYEFGCSKGQGYLISRPIDERDIYDVVLQNAHVFDTIARRSDHNRGAVA